MGRETFTDHDDIEVPDFEIEEDEDEGKGKKPASKKKDEDEDPYEDILDDVDEEEEDKGKKKEDEEDEEEVVDEEDLREQLVAKDEELASERAERVRLQNEKITGEFDQAKYLSGAIDKQLEGLRGELIQAKKDEDVEKETNIQAKIDELKEAKRKTEDLVRDLEPKVARIKAGGGGGGDERPQQPGEPRTPKARAWAKRNGWMNDPKFKIERGALISIDGDLVEEGFNPNSDRYFQELSRRLAKKFPSLEVKHIDGKPVVRTKRKPGGDGKRRSPVGQPGTSGRSAEDRSSGEPRKVRLEAGDKETMRKFGLDPADKGHVKHFLRSKAERLEQERRNRDDD